MDRPDSSGEVLRAIARVYRDEIGPARAEQLASRAIARAGERSHRYQRIGLLASSVPLAASLVVLGIGVLTGNSDSIAPVNSDPAPVVSGPEVSEGAQVPTLTKEGLLEALDLIEPLQAALRQPEDLLLQARAGQAAGQPQVALAAIRDALPRLRRQPVRLQEMRQLLLSLSSLKVEDGTVAWRNDLLSQVDTILM